MPTLFIRDEYYNGTRACSTVSSNGAWRVWSRGACVVDGYATVYNYGAETL